MSSYHTSFSYNGENSLKDRSLIVVTFEPDEGLKDTFLSMDVVSDDYYDGTKKYTYGSRYNTQATITITVIKSNGQDFSLKEVRSHLKWLTGSRVDSWLDMYVGDEIKYSFLGRITDVQQYKLDARTVGLTITFSSVSPWAYSAPQVFDCSIWQLLSITDNGVLSNDTEDTSSFGYDNGVLCANPIDNNSYFNITDNGVVYVDNSYRTIINNQSDDLYTYIYLDIDYKNKNSTFLSVKNVTLDEETKVTNISVNESISISAKQFIISDIPNKIFGDSFNFIWPRLRPGLNNFVIEGDAGGSAKFTYRYPMKIGDCAMDISVYGSGIDCSDCDGMSSYDTVKWENIINTPTTISGYGITDAYTINEVDNIVENIEITGGDGTGNTNIDEQELNDMLAEVLT